MSDRPPLRDLQRWMLAVITCPGGVEAGAQSAAARDAIGAASGAIGLAPGGTDLAPGAIASIVKPSATLSAAGRLSVYHRAYQARLLEAFRGMFPAWRHAAGDALLDAFARDYLARHPPRSFTLADLAAAFPEHLEATRPDRGAAARERWPDFLVELASVERAVLEVAEGPGMEGRPLPDARDLLLDPPDALVQRRPAPAPCLRLFACAFPVHRYLRAVRAGAAPPLPDPAPSLFAVSRRDYRVVLHDLAAGQHAFLAACDGRRTVMDVLDTLEAGRCALPETGNLRDWLSEWAARGLFASLEA